MTDWLTRAQREGTPLIDGEQVTFVWEGKTAPRLIGDFTNWATENLKQAAPGLWTHSTNLPRDAYIEYAYLMDGERVPDPFNKRLITNGIDAMNHYFSMPDAVHTTLVKNPRGGLRGKLTRHMLDGGIMTAGGKRPLWLYQPPTDQSCPLLVVWDGKDYATRAKLPIIVDNLITQGRIEPLALAMPQHGGRARFVEYMCNDATLGFLMFYVLPYAKQYLNLLEIETRPGAFGILGASMGGLMALYTGLRLPHIFGRVISQSGGFGFEINGQESVIFDLVRQARSKPSHISMDVGRYEWLLPSNRKILDVLQSSGYKVAYQEYNGGHNYTAWRDQIPDELAATFGKQQR
jgi:enterochelin esterase-like enzyme